MSTRQERADQIRRKLNTLYPDLDIPLKHRDPYTLLVAVILSAQCTDRRVNEVTPALFAAAGSPPEMVALGRKRIRELIAACGLANNKSKALYEMSQQLLANHAGTVPRTFAELEALPGVGHKTASVVMAQAFGIPAFPVDTHIHRLAKRWGLSSGKNVKQTEKDLKELFPKASWAKLHQFFL